MYAEEEVEQAIGRLAVELIRGTGGINPVALCVLNGSIIVTGRLLTQLPFLLELDSVHVIRFPGKTHGNELALAPSSQYRSA